MLDGGLYNSPEVEPEPGGKVDRQGPPSTEEEAIRRDLEFAAAFDPSYTPERIESMIADWREKQEAAQDA